MGVEVRGLSFAYGARRVLEDIDFEARDGELLAVLGPNGAGKSTLFNCVLGLLKPERGEIRIGGEALRAISPRALARRIAYVPQSHAPTFNYSVFDMALMGTTAHVGGFSVPGAAQAKLAEDALAHVGISHLRARGFMQISGGERQLSLIARALAQQARILIMDEPTANLDYGNRLRLMLRVKELAGEGYTVIQSTHDPDHAFLFADRVLALNAGRVAAAGPPREAVTEALIESLYGVRVRLAETRRGNVRCEPVLTENNMKSIERKL
ncbi:MAG: ABC transporter ATP-binding protein [Clostridiales Family XIII bacterium]|jgi:iron complex transport system ATP-binding protein|nr:ABC transporter ATP-binding protein [Clostridiales Family XIII bacterium]